MSLQDAVMILASLLTALTMGVFFGFMVAVNPGLHRLTDREYVKAMQSINRVILNPLFMIAFIGPVLLLPLVLFWARNAEQFVPLLIAAIAYIIGVFGVTSVANVPLNDQLARLDLRGVSDTVVAQARTTYEQPWNRLHVIRTLFAIVATVSMLVSYVV